MVNKDFKSVIELLETFDTEQKCIDHLEQIRWTGNVVSPFDPDSVVYKCKNNRYRCRKTGKYFNVRTQTLFEGTKIPLRKWFVAIWLITGHKKGISSLQLSRELDITQKTAWFMLHRIRNCYDIDYGVLSGEVEVDETYVGGKNKNRHKHKKIEGTQGRSLEGKSAVLGMAERDGEIKAFKITGVSSFQIQPEVMWHVDQDAKVYTDEWAGYKGLGRIYDHKSVVHKKGEYVRGRVHTNTIEGFWSLLKRMINGTYHFTSSKHLQKYVDEMVFRYNTRNQGECSRFNAMLSLSGSRLTYQQLIYNGKEEVTD